MDFHTMVTRIQIHGEMGFYGNMKTEELDLPIPEGYYLKRDGNRNQYFFFNSVHPYGTFSPLDALRIVWGSPSFMKTRSALLL